MLTAEIHRPNTQTYGLLGDLGPLSPAMRTAILNRTPHVDQSPLMLTDTQQRHLDVLTQELRQLKLYIAEPFHYPQGASTLADTLRNADNPYLPPSERIRQRLSAFSGTPRVGCDLDDTLSKGSHHYIPTHLPGSDKAEPWLTALGRDEFARVFVTIWQPFLHQERGAAIYRENGKHIPLRPGVPELFAYWQQRGIDRTILSANFDPFVHGVLEQIGEDAKGTEVFAVTKNSILSTQKGDMLRHLAQLDPTRPFIYIGDGSSDLPAIEANSVIAGYMALEGGAFAQQLRHANIPHLTFKTGYNIKEHFAKLIEDR